MRRPGAGDPYAAQRHRQVHWWAYRGSGKVASSFTLATAIIIRRAIWPPYGNWFTSEIPG